MKTKRILLTLSLATSILILACQKDSESPSPSPTSQSTGTISDIDGNTYQTIQIGPHEWIASNLRTTRYSDGSSIPNVTISSAWVNLTTGAWCSFNNNMDLDTPYGKLYNWYAAVDPRGICPVGWHLPSDAEWQQLELAIGLPINEAADSGFRGTAQNIGGKMKSTTLWESPNTGATNSSGFSGLPAGAVNNSGYFLDAFGSDGFWWSGSEDNTGSNAWFRSLNFYNRGVERDHYPKNGGFCVRCVRN